MIGFCARSLWPVLLVLVAACPGLAGELTDQLKQTTDKVLALVQDPALKGPDKDAEREKQIKKLIDARFDWETMARSAMGPHWRNLSDVQRKEFTDLLSQLIQQQYKSKVESYSGEKIIYKGDRADGKYGVADVVVVTRKGVDVPVAYGMLKKGTQWVVYDVSIEGVSLVNNYRSQISAILNSSSYDDLIKKLKAKLAENALPTSGPSGSE